ncbi:MAG: 2,3,4,5-tetrahydropyridine-2,6-dicarboxylate N-succinyltransferase [Endozoicomonadaceae bacterium]|nr:2,3,4,5-tetrahydropyridine-2,6-dicarboxylate N-succinyltransferase [Endozoicomonadaceae bacterium]
MFFALAAGIGTHNTKDDWLEVYYPAPLFQPAHPLIEKISSVIGYTGGNVAITLDNPSCHALENIFHQHGLDEQASIMTTLESADSPKVLMLMEHDLAPTTTPEIYLKLHLISHRFVKPHEINFKNIFSLLPNVAWTIDGAIDPEELPYRQLRARAEGRILEVTSIDKFPKMANYVVPSGVRIAQTARVRLGAYVGAGTTIMHEGFINFNAGTEGRVMVEGRISAGVFIGQGSDLGGGCSTMGTLSGGNDVIISVGENCLIGANAGIGISLGNRCTVEAGLYLTSTSKVQLLNEDQHSVEIVKAKSLAGLSDLLFRRNSITGAIECLVNPSAITLNEELHTHN